MESWKCILSECRAVPSSCEIRVPLFPSPLTALANGSQFVYFLDSKNRKQLAVLKFSAAVLHISNMNFHDETDASMMTCCLADGQIMAFSVENFLRKVRKESEAGPSSSSSSSASSDPLFQPFLGVASPLGPSRRKAAIDAKTVSVCIGICPASEWVLISAVILDNNLCMCRRSRSMGGVSYVLLRSHQRNIRVPSGGRGTITIPSFVGAVEVQSSIASAERSEHGHSVAQRIMDCKPVFALVRSEKHAPSCCGDTITAELFLCLFGSEFQLFGAPVVLVGCQNGNVLFLNSARSSIGAQRSRDQEFMCPLCSLAQPVVAIHSAYFPRRRPPVSDDLFTLQEVNPVADEAAEKRTHNALIFIGQDGKIVVCHADSDGRGFPRFREFHVPGPVLSSVAVPGQCLLYSTPQGLHRICLRRVCADSIEENVPSAISAGAACSIKIPEVSFKFPEAVQSLHCGTYLVQGEVEAGGMPGDVGTGNGGVDAPPAETGRRALHCLCVSLDGRLTTVRTTACADARETSRRKTITQVGREMKQCLRCIQSQSEETDRVMEKIQSLNSVLIELKGTLDMLLAVQTAANASHATRSSRNTSPITCSFKTSRERVGASAERLCVTVEAVYRKLQRNAEALSDGWSLVVMTKTGKHSTHKTVSLAGLVAGDSVAVATDVELGGGEGVLGSEGCVECFLQYSPHRLHERLPHDASTTKSDAFKGVSLFLARKYFDILDFLCLHKHSSRETLSSCRSRAVKLILSESAEATNLVPPRPPFPALLHSVTLPISLSAATNVILATSSSVSADALQRMAPGELAAAFLGTLIPATAGKPRNRSTARGLIMGGVTGTAGQGSELLAGFDGERIGLKLSSDSGEGGVEERWSLEIRGSSRDILVRVVSSVSTRLRRGRGGGAELEGSEESCDHATLCGKLAVLEGTLEEIGQVQREISSGHMEWRTNCMSGEEYRKALLIWRAKAHSIYCKLREIIL